MRARRPRSLSGQAQSVFSRAAGYGDRASASTYETAPRRRVGVRRHLRANHLVASAPLCLIERRIGASEQLIDIRVRRPSRDAQAAGDRKRLRSELEFYLCAFGPQILGKLEIPFSRLAFKQNGKLLAAQPADNFRHARCFMGDRSDDLIADIMAKAVVDLK